MVPIMVSMACTMRFLKIIFDLTEIFISDLTEIFISDLAEYTLKSFRVDSAERYHRFNAGLASKEIRSVYAQLMMVLKWVVISPN
jgi:hypothetical protein